MNSKELIIKDINQIPGYNTISEENKIKLNVLIDTYNLTLKLTTDYFVVGEEELMILILNFYEKKAKMESFSLISEGKIFTDADVKTMFENM